MFEKEQIVSFFYFGVRKERVEHKPYTLSVGLFLPAGRYVADRIFFFYVLL
jgi:hypothetical protein